MQKCLSLLATLLLLVAFQNPANAVEYKFATAEEAAEILAALDDYYYRMSPAEIAIRMKLVTPDKTPEDLKAYYAENVLDWPEDVQAQFQGVIDASAEKLTRVDHLLPDVIYLIRATNNIEGGYPHTHGTTIILQTSVSELTADLLFHETFHVLSRNNPDRHDSLYGLLGFQGCKLIEPMAIQTIHLTNPDVPPLGYYLPVEKDGQTFNAIPFLYAARPAFDPEVKGGFGGHFGFDLLKVKVEKDVCIPEINALGAPEFVGVDEVTGFYEAIGKNTGYIIHPEEVLADNFSFLLRGKSDLPNPEILERLNDWLLVGK